MRKAELENLKSFITRQVDIVRLAYRRNTLHMPRRFVIVGTTNNLNCLPNDPDGNRRFIPLKLIPKGANSASKVRKYLDEHREQLWSEALQKYHLGAKPRLPEEYKARAKLLAENHRDRDEALESAILTVCDELMRSRLTTLGKPLPQHECIQNGLFCLSMMRIETQLASIEGLNYRRTIPEQRTVGTTLRLHGWDKKRVRINGKQYNMWTKKLDK